MTLLAIAPLIPIVALLAAAGGLFAFLRKRTPSAPAQPGQISATPFLNLESGTTTAMLERKGATWSWSVSGPVTATGGDADPGAAAMAMAQALVASEDGAAITGSAGGPSSITVELGVEPDGDEWDWSVTSPSNLPAAVPGTPSPPNMLGYGHEETRSTALIRALVSTGQQLDWLTISTPGLDAGQGGGLPPKPANVLPGLTVVGNRLAITSLPAWLAYEAPHMRAAIASDATADEIMDDEITGGADLPADTRLNGKPLTLVRTTFRGALASVRKGDYVGIAPPDQHLSALLVGGRITDPTAWVGAYHDHVILVRKAPKSTGGGGGFSQPVGDRFEWLAWSGDMRGYDADIAARGTMSAGRTQNQTIRYAKQQVDQDFPQTGAGDSGGNTSSDINPDGAPPANPSPDLPTGGGATDFGCAVTGYHPVRTQVLPRIGWAARNTVEVELFKVTGKWANCSSYNFAVGICLRDLSAKPYGDLTSMLHNYSTADMQLLPVSHPQQGWPLPQTSMWQSPPTWKMGLRCKLTVDGGVEIVGGVSDDDGTAASINACPGEAEHWPSGPLNVQATDLSYSAWDATPIVTLFVKNKSVMLRINYTGLPQFYKNGADYHAVYTNSKLTLITKVSALGAP